MGQGVSKYKHTYTSLCIISVSKYRYADTASVFSSIHTYIPTNYQWFLIIDTDVDYLKFKCSWNCFIFNSLQIRCLWKWIKPQFLNETTVLNIPFISQKSYLENVKKKISIRIFKFMVFVLTYALKKDTCAFTCWEFWRLRTSFLFSSSFFPNMIIPIFIIIIIIAIMFITHIYVYNIQLRNIIVFYSK